MGKTRVVLCMQTTQHFSVSTEWYHSMSNSIVPLIENDASYRYCGLLNGGSVTIVHKIIILPMIQTVDS